MSAPSIPNLFSLRGAKGGSAARGRPSRRGGSSAAGRDATVQGTDTDAAVSRMSAVSLGYLDDPFAQYFVQTGPGPSSRRLPIINRGTYTRTAGLDALVDRFLTGSAEWAGQRQIVSLGAGTDTRSLRLLRRPDVAGLVYHEIDFPLICTKKLNIIKSTPVLRDLLSTPTVEGDGSWRCGTATGFELRCHGIDLRRLFSTTQDSSAPTAIAGLRTDIPTLLISECCLCYLETTEAADAIRWFTDRIPDLGVLVYEPTKPDDAFGRTMISNLAARGITMPTLETYRQPDDQDSRLKSAGFEQARHLTVDDIWTRWIPQEEKERVDGLEGLDEVEEWKLLAGHYIVSWGWRGNGFGAWEKLG